MKKISLLLLLITFGCSKLKDFGESKDPPEKTTTDNAFAAYVEMFEQDSGDSVAYIPINFGNTVKDGKTYAGICWYYNPSKDPKEIVINEKIWNQLSEYKKKSLIYHELGHCHLRLDHDHDNDGCPTSLMSPKIPPQDCLEAYWQTYLDRLFN